MMAMNQFVICAKTFFSTCNVLDADWPLEAGSIN